MSVLVTEPSQGGLSSASPFPLPLIRGRLLPRLPLPHSLGGMVLDNQDNSI